MRQVMVVLKTKGWKYSGELISETETKLIINDIKLGRLEIDKAEIAVRGDF